MWEPREDVRETLVELGLLEVVPLELCVQVVKRFHPNVLKLQVVHNIKNSKIERLKVQNLSEL